MNRATLYKLQLASVKVVPIIVSALYLLNTLLSFLGFRCTVLDYIAGTSLITALLMYISSYAFRFCKYHRMFIHYILICNIIDMLDFYVGIPVSDSVLLYIFLALTGIFSYLALYYHTKYGERKVITPSCWTAKESCPRH